MSHNNTPDDELALELDSEQENEIDDESEQENEIENEIEDNLEYSHRHDELEEINDDAATSNLDDDSQNSGTFDNVTGRGGESSPRKGYKFRLDDDGDVIGLRKVKGDRVKRERIEDGESWSFNSESGELIRTELNRSGIETKIFTDLDGDKIFTRASEFFTPFSSSSLASPI